MCTIPRTVYVIEGEFILCVPYQEQFIGNRRRIRIMCTIARTVYR